MKIKLFRPSSAPPLEICTHFESLDKQTAEREEGDNFHKDCAAFFKRQKTLSDIPKSRRDNIRWAYGVQKEYCPWVIGVERRVEVYGEADVFITEGTVDLDGEIEFDATRIPAIVDWKPGDYIERSAQLAIYSLAKMDESGSFYCRMTTAYYKDQTTDSRIISYPEAQKRVFDLIERLSGKRGPELYNISAWCSFCAVRMREGGCPAWEEQRLTLAETNGFPATLSESLVAIKADPVRRAKFIIAKRRFDSLVKAYELEEDALKDILEGKPGHGLKKQSRGFSLVIDKDYQAEE